ncbi:MAG: bifunctional metallophosphatase/5'-nucleotidase [Elusimicrobiaceae bacterium]|nr:bifunctional metallophosphatase/5'-nucleotidase [Elusimicrobiaceae bacterium]
MKLRLLILLCVFFCACSDNKTALEIYHTGAISGYFYAQTFGEEHKSLGGLPALKKLLSGNQEPFLLFDSGNLFSVTREGQIAKMSGTLNLLSKLPYTAITLSAEDFKFGAEDIRNALKNNKIPIVISNLKNSDGSTPKSIQNSMIIDFEGVKLGVLGVLSKGDFDNLVRSSGFKAYDEIESLKPLIESLKKEEVNIIILLSSLGFERQDKAASDKTLLDELTDIDILLGIGKENTENSKIIINHSQENLQQVSLINLILNKNKQISSHNSEDILLDISTIGEDEDLLREVNILKQQVAKTRTRHIAKIDTYLGSDGQDSALGLYTAACLKKWGKTTIGLMNLEALGEGLPQGDVTEEDMYKAFPFDDRVMFVKMYGANLQRALENNLISGHQAALSGIKISYDKENKMKKIIINGQELQRKQLYDIAMPDHLISNAPGYEEFLNMYEFKNTDRTVRDIVTWCLNRKNTDFKNKSAWQQI